MPGPVFILTTGTMGSGKSYARVQWLVQDYLLDPDAKLMTNVRINLHPAHERVSKTTKESFEEFENRITILDQDDMTALSESGPLAFFDRFDSLDGVRLVIDEAQHYMGTLATQQSQKQWITWISEARHEGATLEAMTQDINNLPKGISRLAIVRNHVADMATLKDPFFNIPLDDWWQLKAKVFGSYVGWTEVVEYRRADGSREKKMSRNIYPRRPSGFELYDSFQVSKAGRKGQGALPPWKRLSLPRLLIWFASRNTLRVVFNLKVWYSIIALWLISGGANGLVHEALMYGRPDTKTGEQQVTPVPVPESELPPEQGTGDEATGASPQPVELPPITIEDGIQNRPTPALPRLTGVMTGAAVTNQGVFFVGEIYGRFNELPVLESVDVRRGLVVLADGTRLRIGSEPEADVSNVSRRLPPGNSRRDSGDTTGVRNGNVPIRPRPSPGRDQRIGTPPQNQRRGVVPGTR